MDPTYFDYDGKQWAARLLPDGRLAYRPANQLGVWWSVDDTTDPKFSEAIIKALG